MFGSRVNTLGKSNRFDPYGVGGLRTPMVAAFDDEYYRSNGSTTTFSNLITHSRAGLATMTDGYGPELVTNGTFDTDSDWTLGGASEISNGKAVLPTVSDYINQHLIGSSQGVVYKVTFNYTEIPPNNGGGIVRLSNITGWTSFKGTGFNFSGSGSAEFYIKSEDNDAYLGFYLPNAGTPSASTTIDNVTVREMPVIKWAPHNLVTYSEDFSNAAWGKSISTVDGNSAVAPDGSSTADALIASVGSGSHFVYKNFDLGDYRTFGVFVKAKELTHIAFSHKALSETYVFFDVGNGVVGDSSNFIDTSITDVGNGWYLCKATLDVTPSTTTSYDFVIALADGASVGDNYFVGDGASGIYIWGAHLYRSDLGGMVDNPDRGDSYVPTTSSAAYLPRRGHHVYNGYEWVNEGVLAESEARTNLVTYSNDFTDASWTKDGATIDSNAGSGPDGLTSADRINVTPGAGDHQVFASFPGFTSGDTVCHSVFVKMDGGRYTALSIYWSNDVFVSQVFDLLDGSKGDVNVGSTSGTLVASGAVNCGNGWWRLWVAGTSAAPSGSVYLAIDTADSLSPSIEAGSGAPTYTAVDGEDYLVYGAQCEIASTPSSYIPTSGSTVTRAAETFTIPSANLPWPTPQYIGSELVTNGTFDTDISSWSAYDAGGIAPVVSWDNGRLKIVFGGNIDGVGVNLTDALVANGGGVYLLEFDWEVQNWAAGNVLINQAGGSLGSGSWGGFGNITIGSSSASGSFSGIGASATANSGSWLNIQAGGVNAGSTTLWLDNISVREINPLSVSIQMDGRMTYADDDESNAVLLYYWNEDNSNYIRSRLKTLSTATGEIGFLQAEAGTNDLVETSATYLNPDVLVPYNIASRNGSTFINGAVDGVALTANTTPTALPDLSSTDLSLAYKYMGTIKTFRVFDKDIGDTGIVKATAPSLEPSLSLSFDSTETSFTNKGWSE